MISLTILNNKEKVNLEKSIDSLKNNVEKLNSFTEKSDLGNTKKLLMRNFFLGIFKGVGMGIGFYIITAVVIVILNYIVKLNIPIIGDYISDIVEIVEINRK